MINIKNIEFFKSIILWKCVSQVSIRVPLYIKNSQLYCIVVDTDDTDFGKLVCTDISYIGIYQLV